MVSGIRCPAQSDPMKKWSESRAAASKSRCPVGRRGEFPDVHLPIRSSVCLSFHPPPFEALINAKSPQTNILKYFMIMVKNT